MSKRRRLAVVKVGGDVVQSAAQLSGLGQNIKELVDDDWDVIVLHGGGPQTTALQERLGLKATKIGGRRVTSKDDLVIVTQAVCGEVNVALTCALLAAGVRGFGCHGASGGLIEADKRPPTVVPSHGPEPVDFGEVGDVIAVDEVLLRGLLHLGVVPVIATLGVSSFEGRPFNINADTVAVEIARTLEAELLLLVTGVGGVFTTLGDAKSRIGTLTAARARALIAEGVIAGGMIPKVEEALTLLDAGVGAVAILDAAAAHAFASAAKGDGALGTRLTA
ncbi:MAG: acetylglutamate kinase [Deltaproteobacteria bacterium]|nr:acetylglutamate kinase [Deltaproteobacteria bacterium]